MDVFDELVDSEVGIVIPHVKSLVEFCLHIAMNTELSDSSRVKALHFIGWLIRVKSKVILKNKLLSPILSVIFPIMATRGEEDVGDGECEDEDDAESLTEAEDSRPNAVAAQVRANKSERKDEKYLPFCCGLCLNYPGIFLQVVQTQTNAAYLYRTPPTLDSMFEILLLL